MYSASFSLARKKYIKTAGTKSKNNNKVEIANSSSVTNRKTHLGVGKSDVGKTFNQLLFQRSNANDVRRALSRARGGASRIGGDSFISVDILPQLLRTFDFV